MSINILQYLFIPLGYLAGSIPTAFIIGKLIGKFDLRTEGDGKVSAAAIYRRLKIIPFLIVVVIDVLKGFLVIILASYVTDQNWLIIMLTGIAAVAGHNWPVFLGFKGGLGATVMWGVLGGAVLFQLFIAFIPTITHVLLTKKSSISTAIGILSLSLVLLIQKILAIQGIIPWDIPWFLIPFPIILVMLMILKHFQITRAKKASKL
jgi:glycerol-3-phosphate acyltransferase PlsY